MAITEFAILVFKPPHNLSEPAIQPLFRQLSDCQSECSGFPLAFFTNSKDPSQVHLITGWDSIEAHEAWIRGERNQELLRVFSPFIDMPKISMVHLDVEFESIPKDARRMIIERYDGPGSRALKLGLERTHPNQYSTWSLVGRDLASDDGGDVYRFSGGVGEFEEGVKGRGVLVALGVGKGRAMSRLLHSL